MRIQARLISTPGGRFPRARPQSIEQRRVRFAVFLRTLQKLRHPSLGVFGRGRVNFFLFLAFPAGVAALHYNQLVLTIIKNFFSGLGRY